MDAIQLEPRPLYGIGTVARLTGLKPDTLRVWERRYGLGASHKSNTGRRQYTQSDLEHLQIVATLVGDGVRIGEIAALERKTLDMMLRGRAGQGSDAPALEDKPQVMLVGRRLCDWLDEHQGCVSGVHAHLARGELNELSEADSQRVGEMDTLVLDVPRLNAAAYRDLQQLLSADNNTSLLVVYHFASERWLSQLRADGVVAVEFPPDPGELAFQLQANAADNLAGRGERNLGELVSVKPRQFSSQQLAAVGTLEGNCQCPEKMAELIQALAAFEQSSAVCPVDDWREAAVQCSIFTYASQARWLMEKALQTILENHPEVGQPAPRSGAG